MTKHGAKSGASMLLERRPDLRSAMTSSSLFEKLRSGLKRVTLDDEEYYVAEGDTLLDEDQLFFYAFNREKVEEARNALKFAAEAGLGVTGLAEPPSTSLVGLTRGGRFVRWSPGVVLSYRVARNTFTTAGRYNLVIDGMRQAIEAWQNTCGVRFEHQANLDTAPGVGPQGAVFTVRELDVGGAFIAAAFFPTDPPSRRRIVIDPSFYADNLTFDKVGVLRHELGHVLGFRHEHIRSEAPPACPDEPLFDAGNITKYDPQSVMHYFCGGVGRRELAITAIDRAGSQAIYGPPLSQVEFIDL